MDIPYFNPDPPPFSIIPEPVPPYWVLFNPESVDDQDGLDGEEGSYLGIGNGFFEWYVNRDRALRFSRKEDAEALLGHEFITGAEVMTCLPTRVIQMPPDAGTFTPRPPVPGKLTPSLKVVSAYQWWRNGDHPEDYQDRTELAEDNEVRLIPASYQRFHGWEGQVVRRFRHPEVPGADLCSRCYRTMNEHGWIDEGKEGLGVCPGNLVCRLASGQYVISEIRYLRQPRRAFKTLPHVVWQEAIQPPGSQPSSL